MLLARRTANRDLAGLWEFPGGKREAGESFEDALARELHEELGIEARVGAHLITVPQAMPSKRLRLHVRHVSHWTGVPRGREGQALAWVPPHKLPGYAMPPADLPVVAALLQPDRYAISPGLDGSDGDAWLRGLDAALAAGVRRVQIRLPGLDDAHRRALAAAAVARCRAAGAAALINADQDIARELGIGLHLPAAQLAGVRGRPELAEGALLAASCHDAGELARAAEIGCDFVVLGAVKATASHPGEAGMGWQAFAALRETVALPIYALGGLVPGDLEEARRHGAQGIAAIRGLWPLAGKP